MHAQTELRPSVIGSRLDPQVTPELPKYNLKFRAIDFQLSTGLEAAFNDNITQSMPAVRGRKSLWRVIDFLQKLVSESPVKRFRNANQQAEH